MELDVLNGATRTLARDRPVFTVELHPHTKRDASLAAWSLINGRLGEAIAGHQGLFRRHSSGI